MHIKLNTISLSLIIPASGLYITTLPISPIYFFLSLGFLTCILYSIYNPTTSINYPKTTSFSILFIVYLILNQIANDSNISPTIGKILSLLTFLTTLFIAQKIKLREIEKICYLLPKLSIPLLIFECFYRFKNPQRIDDFIKAGREDILFYIYKLNSIMYLDSNFVAIYILMLIFFTIYLDEKFNNKNIFLELILLTLLILTISRAAILSYLITRLVLLNFKIIKKYKTILYLFFPIFLLFAWNFIFNNKESIDDSLTSKFLILELLINFIHNSSLKELLIGVGLGNAEKVIQIGAHNIFATYLIELGLIGCVFMITTWITCIFLSKNKVLILLLPFFINGLSLTSLSTPYLYAMLSIIITLERSPKNAPLSLCTNTRLQCRGLH